MKFRSALLSWLTSSRTLSRVLDAVDLSDVDGRKCHNGRPVSVLFREKSCNLFELQTKSVPHGNSEATSKSFRPGSPFPRVSEVASIGGASIGSLQLATGKRDERYFKTAVTKHERLKIFGLAHCLLWHLSLGGPLHFQSLLSNS